MKYLRYLLTAFWLVAIFWLGYKTSHNIIVFRLLLTIFSLFFLTALGYLVRSHLEQVLRWAGKMWFGFIALGLVFAVTSHTQADEVLTFNPEIPAGFSIELPRPAPQIAKKVDGKGPLDIACETHAAGDAKCACVNNAIFKHDSSWGTAGVGKKTNNLCNMRPPKTWTPSVQFTVYRTAHNGEFAKFATREDGITACVELYSRFYRDMSALQLVRVWTDGGGNAAYRSQVASCY
ncbi:MAG: hypothetical protein AB7O68_16965 [Pirellulales bacterium]